ncbi:hypothetical protein N476_05185 [Pseudoalteromonas luteoviolacea H33]|uniref:Uncharacterized protein n=1 Tax=Pseudoalteromonas luteoviolacea H33 TaxID=1365251 RepID=A0A162A7K7_9GAMM|nr:hypothetical protein N476_05185 [Pseudoalteromonas luteoviolacea H33]KZN70723.1 hypothetical protein N477_04855 [Pseudoalteromonas luteoviolacea H33-S]
MLLMCLIAYRLLSSLYTFLEVSGISSKKVKLKPEHYMNDAYPCFWQGKHRFLTLITY